MPERFKVALIGTGGRSVPYAQHYVESGLVDVVALADPSPENRVRMATKSKLPGGFAQYDRWEDMLREQQDLDGVVITSPNFAHADQAVAALERGLPIALEKPLSPTQQGCERILDAQRANHGRTLLGFVLRSAPFYSRIQQIIASGAIGRVVAVQADELVGAAVTSLMLRNPWRRYTRTSGGSLLEKCCHDIDILNWIINARPIAVSAFGGELHFSPSAALPDECDGCSVADTCAYYKAPQISSHEDEGERVLQQFTREVDLCIYNIDKDVADVQSVNIQYENGAVANFLLSLNCVGDRSSRNFHAIGTRGRVWGNLNECSVQHHDNATGKTTSYETRGDGSGHGGGDRRHAMELVRMMQEPSYHPACNAEAGYQSAVVCFAAEQSRAQGRQVRLQYGEHDRVALVSH